MSTQAYTPGLKRKETFVVEKTRRLPIPGDVLVKEGDAVSQDTVVAKTSVPGEPHVLDVARTMGLAPEEVMTCMKKKVGDPIEKGEPIASYESFFGMVKRACLSPATGQVERFSTVTGQAIIREQPTLVEVKAYVPGTVVKVLPNDGVVIRTTAAFIQGIFGIGGETYGELMMISKTPEGIIDSSHVTSEFNGKVVVGGALVDGDGLRRLVEVGARAVIVGGIKDRDIISLLGYDVGVAITGHEEVGLTVIITEGFGKMAMQQRTFSLLGKFEGKLACVNGATQIRAGVMRPEVIIPRADLPAAGMPVPERDGSDSSSEGLNPGTLIRLIREPYFGALGKVVSLPAELQRLRTESMVRVLEAQLEDGRQVVVPRANVEIIEE